MFCCRTYFVGHLLQFCFSRGVWGMDFLSDCSVRIPSNPVSWGVNKLFLFGVWIFSRTVLSAFLSNPVSWGVSKPFLFGVWIFSISVAPSLSCKHSLCYFQVSGGAFAGSRISVAPSLSCKYSLFYFQVSGCAFAGPGIQFGDQDLSRTLAEL